MLGILKKIIPKKIFSFFQPLYHLCLAQSALWWYGNPSKKIKVVGVTGTKGKSSTTEFINAILEAEGYSTALMSTIRFKIGNESRPNLYKMSMPGRFFVQNFIHEAVKNNCDWVILEITSEGIKQFRHRGIQLDAAIFLNISPEHIESHGSFENYLNAKLQLAHLLEKSKKKRRVMIANAEDPHGYKFFQIKVNETIPFKMENARPYEITDNGISFTFDGVRITSPLRGEFMITNALAAATFAKSQGIDVEIIKQGIESVREISGRVQFVTAHNKTVEEKRNFDVVVDYAHTIDSLTKLYQAFPNQRKICVLGNTGGGRDKWKRKGMAEIADRYCDHIILTNEDPYDEDPQKIVDDMRIGITQKPCDIIMDRRQAINSALRRASLAQDTNENNCIVLISGKGTDPYIMEANDKKTPWSDYKVAQEELEKILK